MASRTGKARGSPSKKMSLRYPGASLHIMSTSQARGRVGNLQVAADHQRFPTIFQPFSTCASRCRPRPSWDAAQPIDAEDDDDTAAWQCPWESWVVKLDHSEAPWWAWHQMERFWVDANFFHGSFPARLAESWPRMRSLDLQLNEISGTKF